MCLQSLRALGAPAQTRAVVCISWEFSRPHTCGVGVLLLLLLSKGSPKPNRSIGTPHIWLEIPFPFSGCWTGWLVLGTPVDAVSTGGTPVNISYLQFLGSGLWPGALSLSCECSVPPVCFRGWTQSPSDTGLGPFGCTSPSCAHGNVKINLMFYFLLDQN